MTDGPPAPPAPPGPPFIQSMHVQLPETTISTGGTGTTSAADTTPNSTHTCNADTAGDLTWANPRSQANHGPQVVQPPMNGAILPRPPTASSSDTAGRTLSTTKQVTLGTDATLLYVDQSAQDGTSIKSTQQQLYLLNIV